LIIDADADTSITADTDDQIDFKTGGTDRMLINASGHVKINNSRTTSVPFHVVGGTASGTTYDTAVFAGGLNSTSGSGAKIYLSGCENDPISRGTYIAGIAVDNGNSHALTFATSGNSQAPAERMRIDNDGQVLFNCTGRTSDAPNERGSRILEANGNMKVRGEATNTGSTDTIFQFYHGTQTSSPQGRIRVTNSSTSYDTSSDYRLKENVVDLDGAITRVKQLLPKRFNFIVDADTTVDGFLAHEAQTVVPEAVSGTHNEVDNDGNAVMQSIDQSKLVPLLTAALQEAITKIETLETKVAALEAAA